MESSEELEKDGSCTVEDDGRGIPVDMHSKGYNNNPSRRDIGSPTSPRWLSSSSRPAYARICLPVVSCTNGCCCPVGRLSWCGTTHCQATPSKKTTCQFRSAPQRTSATFGAMLCTVFPYHYGQTDVSGIPSQLEADGVEVRIRHYE